MTTKITLARALPTDYQTLSEIECRVFYDEAFSAVAWGPQRDSLRAITARANQFAAPSKNPHERRFLTKAMLGDEIVGFAEWKFVTEREEDERVRLEKEKENAGGEVKVEEKTEEQIFKEKEEAWGVGANFKFCEDVFLRGDEIMLASCEGKDFCKLTSLAILPAHQRRGVGTLLLEAGLAEADSLGLQTILGASPMGEGLYRRYGFELTEVMALKLWEYEGGEDLVIGEEARHCFMHRPAIERE